MIVGPLVDGTVGFTVVGITRVDAVGITGGDTGADTGDGANDEVESNDGVDGVKTGTSTGEGTTTGTGGEFDTTVDRGEGTTTPPAPVAPPFDTTDCTDKGEGKGVTGDGAGADKSVGIGATTDVGVKIGDW